MSHFFFRVCSLSLFVRLILRLSFDSQRALYVLRSDWRIVGMRSRLRYCYGSTDSNDDGVRHNQCGRDLARAHFSHTQSVIFRAICDCFSLTEKVLLLSFVLWLFFFLCFCFNLFHWSSWFVYRRLSLSHSKMIKFMRIVHYYNAFCLPVSVCVLLSVG